MRFGRGQLGGLLLLLFILFLLYECSSLIGLLFEDGAADAMPQVELRIEESKAQPSKLTKPAVIPKIIHQTYATVDIPERWEESRKSCVDLHPDYEYKFWTDASSREFIATEYPEYLKMYDSYPYVIQRADAIRYFILAHYGGIYLDLDDACMRRLDPLLAYPAWAPRTNPTGLSNDALGSVPQHPFYLEVIKALPRYNHNWGLKYITVMYSTGPLFLSVIWKEWINAGHKGDAALRTLMHAEYTEDQDWRFFHISNGGSWHGNDAAAFAWINNHWFLATVSGVGIAVSILIVAWISLKIVSHITRRGKKFGQLSMPWLFTPGAKKTDYELIGRIA